MESVRGFDARVKSVDNTNNSPDDDGIVLSTACQVLLMSYESAIGTCIIAAKQKVHCPKTILRRGHEEIPNKKRSVPTTQYRLGLQTAKT